MASPSTPRLTDTPVATTVDTPRLRSRASSSVPVNGDTPCSRDETMSVSSGPSSGTTAAAGEPATTWLGRLASTANNGAFTAEPARSARNSAVQWTTRTPAARAARTSRAVLAITSRAATSVASSGMAAWSPTTPRCSSIVRTAVCSGARSAARSTAISARASRGAVRRRGLPVARGRLSRWRCPRRCRATPRRRRVPTVGRRGSRRGRSQPAPSPCAR